MTVLSTVWAECSVGFYPQFWLLGGSNSNTILLVYEKKKFSGVCLIHDCTFWRNVLLFNSWSATTKQIFHSNYGRGIQLFDYKQNYIIVWNYFGLSEQSFWYNYVKQFLNRKQFCFWLSMPNEIYRCINVHMQYTYCQLNYNSQKKWWWWKN